ncbi:MAG: F0F1 ATP synthase subunit B [Candidatus Omnitrophica bacterium]|nr:F0F1 ATP synthase subunit B [Candidatus Omnitrophota bacterium]
MELFKLLNANEVVIQIICFLLLVAVLKKFLWTKFLKVLDDRRDKIAADFKAIEDAKKGVEDLKNSYEGKILEVNEEARQKIESAVADGKKQSREIVLKAEDEAAKILANAKEDIKVELVKARNELKDSVIELTLAVTEKVIQEKLSDKDDRGLVEQFVKELDKK